ncbi:MAG: phosphoribosylamine--glycine ligase, partial [Acidimicrobiales bacterium]
MRIGVVGAGGREHALAWAMGQTADVVVVPGNAGMARFGIRCAATLDAARPVDLVVIGPEEPLVDGLADRLRANGIAVFGPGAEGARLEGSKAHLKQVLKRAGVPTAASRAFGAGQEDEAEAYLRSRAGPWVVKTDGLAAGKGVLVADDVEDAVADVRAKLSGASFGAAGRTVVVEEGLTGPEVSVLAVCDGRTADDAVVVLPVARDHKRV